MFLIKLQHFELLYYFLMCTTVSLATKIPRLARQDDFKHQGYILNNMLWHDGSNNHPDSDSLKHEVEVADHVAWWYKERSLRYLSVPMPVYGKDGTSMLEMIYEHNVRRCPKEDARNFAKKNIDIVKKKLLFHKNNHPSRYHKSKPYLCRQVINSNGPETLIPYQLTVLGDSHTGVFEVAALRVEHMNATTVHGATIYGLKNINSTSGAALTIRNILNERRRRGETLFDDVRRNKMKVVEYQEGDKEEEETHNSIIVFNMGDLDIHGYGWEKYLVNEKEGIQRSFHAFGNFLKEHVELPGGYDKVILVLPPPPVYFGLHLSYGEENEKDEVNNDQAHKTGASYDDKVKALAKFNLAMKEFCSQRAYCSIMDSYPKIWSYTGHIFRPYVYWVKHDSHLLPGRAFGVMLEQLRETLDARWCVDEEEDRGENMDGSSSSISHQINAQFDTIPSAGSNTSSFEKVGFEPVLIILPVDFGNVVVNFIVNAVHYLSPHQLVKRIAEKGELIEYEGDQTYLMQFLNYLNQSGNGYREVLERKLLEVLGKGWGEVDNHSWVIDDQFDYVKTNNKESS